MDVVITGKNMDIGEAFHEYIKEKVAEIVKKYFNHTFDVTVTITKEGHEILADINAHVGRGILLVSHARNADPYTAFDQALHKVEKRVRKYKNRLRAHHSKHEAKSEKKALQYILNHDLYDKDEDHVNDVGKEPAVIAEMIADLPSLTVSDAVMRMELSDAPVYMFHNKAHEGLNIVYKRDDGNIGWVDPAGSENVRKIG